MLASILCTMYLASAIRPASGLAVEVYTDPHSFTYFEIDSQSQVVHVAMGMDRQSSGCAEILLSKYSYLISPYYNISLGCTDMTPPGQEYQEWATLSKDKEQKVAVAASVLESAYLSEVTNFTIAWDKSGYIAVGKPGDWYPFFVWKDKVEPLNLEMEPSKIRYIAVRTRTKKRTNPNGVSNILTGSWTIKTVPGMNFYEAFITNFHPTNTTILSNMAKYYEHFASIEPVNSTSSKQSSTTSKKN